MCLLSRGQVRLAPSDAIPRKSPGSILAVGHPVAARGTKSLITPVWGPIQQDTVDLRNTYWTTEVGLITMKVGGSNPPPATFVREIGRKRQPWVGFLPFPARPSPHAGQP